VPATAAAPPHLTARGGDVGSDRRVL